MEGVREAGQWHPKTKEASNKTDSDSETTQVKKTLERLGLAAR